MDKIKAQFLKASVQYTFVGLYLFIASLWLKLSQESILAFLMMLTSILVIYSANQLSSKVRIGIGIFVLFILLPFIAGDNRYYMEVSTQVGIYVAMALGLNIVVGFAGLLDLGYVAFFAAGAYSYGIFATAQANNFLDFYQFPLEGGWFWPFLVVGLLVAAVFGILLGLPVLKVKGDYLAIVTLGFGEIVRIIFNNLDKPVNITNGPQGLTPIAQPNLFGIVINTPFHYYFVVLFSIALIILINRRLEDSRLGRAWVAIREDELAAQAMGIPLVKTKLLAFATGASFAGIVGVIFAAKQTYIDPTSFTLMESIGILVMVVLGGSGSVPGVILGAAIVTILQVQLLKEFSFFLNDLRLAGIINLPSQLDPSKFQRFVFGILLVIMALYRPNGLIPAKRKKIDIEELKKLEMDAPTTGILMKLQNKKGGK
ncbi:branched-chain amino acid ABC transporter permease [Microaerobacter geothermalis]|uniref:branched-chain amino acid ABC transporter permease n=1 Tax=Microaerobacter geothermalis TaxID=674972 RepID=UPI001F3D69B4|nr:branched-chain amino acid ABC transporter permease [Microaerobacter geothermalis]MCF6094478.1 branched-chain amino acid ABC transporter permease [Microaerobacter geothermalis]